MTYIVPFKDEDIESMISRFKGKCRKDGLYDEFERKRFYVKPSIVKRNNLKESIKKNNKRLSKERGRDKC
jgi:ribosomal protein S21